jgi:hypothetical protein
VDFKVHDFISSRLNPDCINFIDNFNLVRHEAAQEMRVGPSEPACRRRLQTTLSCIGQKPLWLALRKRHGRRLCQVRIREISVSEPLMRCRKVKDDVKTGG